MILKTFITVGKFLISPFPNQSLHKIYMDIDFFCMMTPQNVDVPKMYNSLDRHPCAMNIISSTHIRKPTAKNIFHSRLSFFFFDRREIQ